MKTLFLILLIFTANLTFAQSSSERDSAKKTITEFFEAFHKQDTVKLKSLSHPNIVLQSISVPENEVASLVTDSFADFLRNIASIPSDTQFEEILHDFEVNIHGKMANVSTPYSFYLNDEFSHCGVNSFQLMKADGKWKIIYLVDTRQKHGCDKA